jgi:hypothetical protein
VVDFLSKARGVVSSAGCVRDSRSQRKTCSLIVGNKGFFDLQREGFHLQ